MTTPSSSSLIAASRDADLLDRFVALGSTLGLSQGEVEAQRLRLAAAPIGDGDSTIASVYEYAVASYKPTPRPGEDSSKVTDAHILAALQTIKTTTA